VNITSHPTPSGANAASAQLTLCNATRSNVRPYTVGPRYTPLPALTPYAEKLLAKAESIADAMLPAPAPVAPAFHWHACQWDTERAMQIAEARQVRALVPRAPHLESAELKARRVRGESDKGHAGMTKAGSASRAHAIAARVHAEMKRDTSHAFPLSAESILAKGRVLLMREGETVSAVRARLAQPCGDTEAQAMRARAHALAPHLSQCERAALDALTLSRMNARRALSDAMASIQAESTDDTREAWTISPHLSPRECKVLHKLRVARRKRAARANWNARDKATRHAARRYIVRRLRLARAFRFERACDAMAWQCAGQRARFHAFGAVVLKEKESGARIGRKAARVIAPAQGATVIDASASGAFEIDAREGTGRPLDAQCVHEMHLAARAVFLKGGTWKEANHEAYLTLARALRDDNGPDTHAKAARAMDRNWKRAQAEFEREAREHEGETHESAHASAESHAEIDESAESTEAQSWERECYALALQGMRGVVAYWMACKSPFRFAKVRADIAAIRDYAWRVFLREDMASMRTADRKADNARNAEYMAAHRLGERVTEGVKMLRERARLQARGEYLLSRNHAARLARENPTQRALITLPVGRAEHTCAEWRAALRKRTLPALALRLCDAATHGSARGTNKREGRESARKAHARKAQSVMRAPLPVSARAALDALTA